MSAREAELKMRAAGEELAKAHALYLMRKKAVETAEFVSKERGEQIRLDMLAAEQRKEDAQQLFFALFDLYLAENKLPNAAQVEDVHDAETDALIETVAGLSERATKTEKALEAAEALNDEMDQALNTILEDLGLLIRKNIAYLRGKS